jgi:hypothetical protein
MSNLRNQLQAAIPSDKKGISHLRDSSVNSNTSIGMKNGYSVTKSSLNTIINNSDQKSLVRAALKY